MRHSVPSVTFATFTLIAPLASAQSKSVPQMLSRTQIDRSCKDAAYFAEQYPELAQTFWEVTAGSIPPAGPALWWRIPNIEQWTVADFLGAHGPNVQAHVWTTPTDMTFVAAFFTSDSGDWAFFVNYCYRPDGTLAHTESTFNSFVAANPPDGIQRRRSRYYDVKGTLLASRTSVSNLSTGEPLRVRVAGNDETAYERIEKLPFFPLLTAATAPTAH